MNLATVWTVPGVKYPKPPKVDPIDEDKNARSRASMARKRAAYYAAGLNSDGQPRKRPRASLAHLTQAEKEERWRQMRKDWRAKRHRAGRPGGTGGRPFFNSGQKSYNPECACCRRRAEADRERYRRYCDRRKGITTKTRRNEETTA